MKTVHPAFDLDTRTWFVDDPPIEAPSLAALQLLLPDYEIIGYQPSGFKGRPSWKDKPPPELPPLPVVNRDPRKPEQPAFQSRVDRNEPHKRGVANPGPKRKYDHELVLDMWAKGHTAVDISKAVNSKPNMVTTIIAYYRKRHDPRAVIRYRTKQ